jgi:hypothetical protein
MDGLRFGLCSGEDSERGGDSLSSPEEAGESARESAEESVKEGSSCSSSPESRCEVAVVFTPLSALRCSWEAIATLSMGGGEGGEEARDTGETGEPEMGWLPEMGMPVEGGGRCWAWGPSIDWAAVAKDGSDVRVDML